MVDAKDFHDEQPTQRVPVISLAELAAQWRRELEHLGLVQPRGGEEK